MAKKKPEEKPKPTVPPKEVVPTEGKKVKKTKKK